MELNPGYKQTEVGVIPEEWEVVPFSELLEFRNGVNADKHAYGKGIPFINVLEVITKPHLQAADIPGRVSLSKSTVDSFAVRRGDLVFNRTSETQEEVGLSSVYLDDAPVVFGGFVIRGRPTCNAVDPVYSGYAFRAPAVRAQIVARGQGAIRANVGQSDLRQVLAPLPPLPEQRAIAEALEDVDELLGALSRLVAKKRDLKQAAMQQLLTGQTRLPGFSGEWEARRLGDVATLHRENVVPAHSPNQLFVHFSLPAFDSGRAAVVEPGAAIGSNKFRVPPGAVLVSRLNPRIPRIWAPVDIPEQAVCSTEFLVLVPKGEVSRSFLHAICSSPGFCEQMELAATGTTGSHQRMNPADALKIEAPFPLMLSEQIAIAAVLSDMDTELAALEQRLAKTRALKQGMMQELLTGRTRLV